MFKHLGALVLAAVILPAASSAAQEKGQVGLTMGYPASVGVIFQASETLAIRPDVTFSTSSVTNRLRTDSATTANTSVGIGVSALWYMAKWDSLRAYFTPRFGYGRSTNELSTGGLSGTSTTSSTYAVSGSFGAAHSLSRRFAVFAEVGFAYSHLTAENNFDSDTFTNPTTTSFGDAWSTRTAIGGILYLK